MQPRRLLAAAALAWAGAGCTNLGGIANELGDAMARQPDAEVVRDGAPAYLIMADTLAQRSPEDAATQMAAARLYSTYAGSFVDDAARRRRLSQRAYDYGSRALCLELEAVCEAVEQPYPEFRETVRARIDDKDSARVLYRFTAAWSGWVQARSGNYKALADLPKIEVAFSRIAEVAPRIDHGNVHTYLGVLLAQRPKLLGGQPEDARKRFERAIALSDGRNLMAKVLFAEHYARLVGNRDLHDRLLEEVLAADRHAGDLTLSNALAQQRARALQSSADAHF